MRNKIAVTQRECGAIDGFAGTVKTLLVGFSRSVSVKHRLRRDGNHVLDANITPISRCSAAVGHLRRAGGQRQGPKARGGRTTYSGGAARPAEIAIK